MLKSIHRTSQVCLMTHCVLKTFEHSTVGWFSPTGQIHAARDPKRKPGDQARASMLFGSVSQLLRKSLVAGRLIKTQFDILGYAVNSIEYVFIYLNIL